MYWRRPISPSLIIAFMRDDGGMVMEDVADEEDFLSVFCQLDKGCAVGVGESQGLLNEDVLAGGNRPGCEVEVEGSGGGDDHAMNFFVIENGFNIIGNGDGWIGFAYLFPNAREGIADGFQYTQFVKIADKILAPVTGTYDGN